MDSEFFIQGDDKFVAWCLASAGAELENNSRVMFLPVTRSIKIGEKLRISYEAVELKLDSGDIAYGWSIAAYRGQSLEHRAATTRAIAEILFRRPGVRVVEFRFGQPQSVIAIPPAILIRGNPSLHRFFGDASDLSNFFGP
jgi:hypothetical protein